MTNPPSHGRGLSLGALVIAVAGLLAVVRLFGCANSSTTLPPKTADHKEAAAEWLKKVVDKYQQAKQYSDEGRLKLSYTREGQDTSDSWPAAVRFARPGRIRIDAYNLQVASDATTAKPQFLALVADAESNNIDNQMVARPAPEKVSLGDFAADPILAGQLNSRFQRSPIQLELLLAEHPLETLFTNQVALAWLADEDIGSQRCRRIEATAEEGKFVFWIDEQLLLVRRVEYPAKSLLPDLAADPLVTKAELVAELTEATFEPKLSDEDFTLATPTEAKLVRAFIVPPVLAGAELLGKSAPRFEFVSPSGEKFNPGTANGKITALYWYAHHPACLEPSRIIEAAQEKFAANKDVVIAAICTEPADVGDKAIVDQLAEWKVSLKAYRDLKESHSQAFGVREFPSVTLLDAEGRVQAILGGPQAIAATTEAINKLILGENLAAEALQKYAKLRREYDKLIAQGGPSLDPEQDPPASEIAPASQASKLDIAAAWSIDLSSPTGLLIDPRGSGKVFVATTDATSRAPTISEFDAAERKVETHPLANIESLTMLRGFASGEDKPVYYAGFTPLTGKVHVFDHEWKLLYSYPDEAAAATTVRDCQLADLDNDGEPELLVAFSESVGIHAVSMKGQRVWGDRRYVPVLSITPSHPERDGKRFALLTGRGGIGAVNQIGDLPEEKVGQWAIAHLFTARFPDATQAGYCALGFDAKEQPCLVGIDGRMRERWNYPLPAITFAKPIDFVASGKLRPESKGEWIAGWADGSIHIVSENGEFDDTFNTGAEIRSVALLMVTPDPLLIVSQPTKVQAWAVKSK